MRRDDGARVKRSAVLPAREKEEKKKKHLKCVKCERLDIVMG